MLDVSCRAKRGLLLLLVFVLVVSPLVVQLLVWHLDGVDKSNSLLPCNFLRPKRSTVVRGGIGRHRLVCNCLDSNHGMGPHCLFRWGFCLY